MRYSWPWACLLLILAAGCNRGAPDGITWIEKGIQTQDLTINLGYRDAQQNGRAIEPVAMITREGEPVAGAMVFVRVNSADGDENVDEEVATVYEQSPTTDAAYYVASLEPPPGAAQCDVHFRIVSPEMDEWTRDVTIPVK